MLRRGLNLYYTGYSYPTSARGGGQIWPPLIFRPQIAKFHKFSCKAIPWTHTFHLRPSKVISDRIQGHSRCPKMIDRFSLKCPHGRNYGPIALKFEMYTQNTLLFDICYVFWKIAKNGDFRFWGSVLTNPQNDPHDPPIIFFQFFCVVTLGYEKILKVSEFEHFRPYGPKIAHTF